MIRILNSQSLATICLFLVTFAYPNVAAAKDFKVGENTTLSIYGQINRGALYVDDGQASELFGTVDNDNSSTRIGLRTSTAIGTGWIFSSNLEVQYEPASTFSISILDQTDTAYRFDENSIRKVEIAFAHEYYGKLSLGQGSLASDGAAEIDLSGTQLVSLDPRFVAGGQFFRSTNGTLSGIRVRNAFNNFDTGRQNRVRYDTPAYAGFTLSAAVGHNVLDNDDDRIFTDVAARYKNTFGDFQVEGGAFFFDFETSSRYGASAAALHVPSGLNMRFAAARDDNGATIFSTKLGLKRDFFEFGQTALSLDYYTSSNLQSSGADSESFGVSAVQKIDNWNLELYATYRNYQFDNTSDNFHDIDVVLSGVRWKF